MEFNPRDFYETGNQIHDDPKIVVFEDFLQPLEIEQLLQVGAEHLQQALVSAAKSGVVSEGRTGKNCWIPHTYNPVIQTLCQRVSEVVGMPLEYAESIQLVHYAQTQQYAPHYDAWDADTERGQRCMAKGGQRLVTCLMYLNEPDAGGGTSFPNLNLKIAAKRGRMLIFHNCSRGSTVRHVNSLHGGMPVETGEKWACNLWFREKRLR